MDRLLDCLAWLYVDATLGATVLLGSVALVMIGCGQPARRLVLERLAILGALAILPLSFLEPVRRTWIRFPMPRGLRIDPFWVSPFIVGRVLLGMSLVGVLVGFLGLLLGWIGARRWLSRTIEPSPETQELLESLQFEGLCWRPRTRVSAHVRRPVLLGTLRPTILIPPDLEEPDQIESLRLGLLHELAHARRFDPLFGFLGHIAASLWFFVPPLWWVRRQMRLDQEFLADRDASAIYGTGPAYASSLVGMAETGREAHPASSASAEKDGVGVSALFQRILMLIRCPYPVESKAPFWWMIFSVALVGGGTVLAAGVAVRPGLEVGSVDEASQDASKHGAFHIARLMFESRPPGPDGRVPPYTLLQKLPRRFEMVVEVFAEPAQLSDIELAGRRLGPLPREALVKRTSPAYHKVRMVRNGGAIQLWVAGQVIPPNPLDRPPTLMLELRPGPGQTGQFRNLVLSW